MENELRIWLDDQHAQPVAKLDAYEDRVCLRCSEETLGNMTPDDARRLAAELLTAAELACKLSI